MDSFDTLLTLVDQVGDSADLDVNAVSFLHTENQELMNNIRMCSEKFEVWRTFTPTPANSKKYLLCQKSTMDQVKLLQVEHNEFLTKLQDAVDSNKKIIDDFHYRTENHVSMVETQGDNKYEELWESDSFVWNFLIIYQLEADWKTMGLNEKLTECVRRMDELIDKESTLVQPGTD